jgi:hypothetical protein
VGFIPASKRTTSTHSGKVVIYILIIVLAAFLVSLALMLTREDPEAVYKKNSNIRVEVLNGCGVNRLAVKVTNILRRKGFNVVKIGNTENQTFTETVVIERSDENMDNAEYLAKQIGCKNIGSDIDPALYIEVTVIVGIDYREIFRDVEKEF